MEPLAEGAEDKREEIKNKLRQCFDGKIVRKDLTKKIKEGANVPVYVLEFLLGQYCSSDDDEVIEQGVQNVKKILAENFVRPDEAQKVLSRLRKNGSYTVIDMVTARLDMKRNLYIASFSNLGVDNVLLEDEYPEKYDRLLCGGIWCIVQLDYEYVEEEKKNGMPVQIRKVTPIQMPHVEIEELKEGRKQFTKEADRILSKVYNNKQMNLSEKDFMARSRSMTQELAKAEQDLAKQSSLGNERSQRIASEIIDQLTTKKMEALDKDYMGIKKNKTENK